MKEKQMTPDQLVSKLNGGGWFRSGTLDSDNFEPVEKAGFEDNILTVDHITIKQPRVFLVESGSWSGQILVKVFYIQREQKEKVDGGGWREIPLAQTVLRLVDKDEVVKAEERRQRIARRDQFLTELNQKFNGKKLAAIKLNEYGGLTVEFEDDAKLEIDLRDDSDGYELVCLVINDICTSSFKAEI